MNPDHDVLIVSVLSFCKTCKGITIVHIYLE